jgi:hypothetical protein
MTKYATCPKSPSHVTFKEKVRVEGEAWLILDATLSPTELQQPHRYTVTQRRIEKLCADCGSAVVTRLPF